MLGISGDIFIQMQDEGCFPIQHRNNKLILDSSTRVGEGRWLLQLQIWLHLQVNVSVTVLLQSSLCLRARAEAAAPGTAAACLSGGQRQYVLHVLDQSRPGTDLDLQFKVKNGWRQQRRPSRGRQVGGRGQSL